MADETTSTGPEVSAEQTEQTDPPAVVAGSNTAVAPEVIAAEAVVAEGIKAYARADGNAKGAAHTLAEHLVELRKLYGNPGSQANRDRVAKLWDGVEMDPADRKRRMSAVNYIVRTLEAKAKGEPTPSEKIAAASRAAREAKAASTETTQTATTATLRDAVGTGRTDPVLAARQVTQLLNGVSGALTAPGEIDRDTLLEIGKAVKRAEEALATVKANLIERARAGKSNGDSANAA